MRQTENAMSGTLPSAREPTATGFDTPADAAVRTLSLAAVLALAAALIVLAFAAPPHATALAFDGTAASPELDVQAATPTGGERIAASPP